MKPWPYPNYIAHRGAGLQAPENTLAAFKVGAGYGYRMFECDVKLSVDDVPYLLHDDTLDRTTNAKGKAFTYDFTKDGLIAADQTWLALSKLDAGSWFENKVEDDGECKITKPFTGEPLPTLQTIASWCIDMDVDINIEIKPCPGADAHTGDVVARYAQRLWLDSVKKPLLTSFSPGMVQ